MALSELQQAISHLEEATERCDHARREANSAAKDLRHATGDAKRVHDRLEALLASIPDRVDTAVVGRIEQQLADRTAVLLDEYQETVLAATRSAHDHVIETFGDLGDLAMGTGRYAGENGDVTIPDLWERHRNALLGKKLELP